MVAELIHKYVKIYKVERTSTIPTTRLRKLLTTIKQLQQFADNDMEQLSKFVGNILCFFK